jgi:hypothetical protein
MSFRDIDTTVRESECKSSTDPWAEPVTRATPLDKDVVSRSPEMWGEVVRKKNLFTEFVYV